MGVATILAARSVVLLALGERKASTVAAALEGPRGPQVPASFLRGHPSTRVVLDKGAARALRRPAAPPTARARLHTPTLRAGISMLTCR